MPDHAVSSSPAVQAQLDRLWALSPGADVLGLERITALLDRLGNPHLRLPPVFHVAGTNGKGSTCAFLRAMLEAGGYRVHAYTSPHLVRFNERIRLAGTLIEDAALAPLLAEVLDAGGDIGASFFEITTAAAFLAFHRTPADACVIEVGLGGRLDATNVLPAPAVCGIASLGIDHEAFLLVPEAGTPAVPIERIAFEKAGIAKSGVPLVTQAYPAAVAGIVADSALAARASLFARDGAWRADVRAEAIAYRDAHGALALPVPALAGAHQADNAALAVAMLRHQPALAIDPAALATGIAAARWPARLQRLAPGPLVAPGREVWLDGGHNRDAGERIAAFFAGRPGPLHLVIGMLANKDQAAIVGPLRDTLKNSQVRWAKTL
ncbi:MAG: folylpolyglutamate synthase/dihydrofolate synthase family protein, partial [Pseudomonadota bacterium]